MFEKEKKRKEIEKKPKTKPVNQPRPAQPAISLLGPAPLLPHRPNTWQPSKPQHGPLPRVQPASLFPAQPSEPLPGPRASAALRFGPARPRSARPAPLQPSPRPRSSPASPASRAPRPPDLPAPPVGAASTPQPAHRAPADEDGPRVSSLSPPSLPRSAQPRPGSPASSPGSLSRRNLRSASFLTPASPPCAPSPPRRHPENPKPRRASGVGAELPCAAGEPSAAPISRRHWCSGRPESLYPLQCPARTSSTAQQARRRPASTRPRAHRRFLPPVRAAAASAPDPSSIRAAV